MCAAKGGLSFLAAFEGAKGYYDVNVENQIRVPLQNLCRNELQSERRISCRHCIMQNKI